MASENTDQMLHDVIGRLFEEPEPTHRADLADGAIAYGMSANRRRGFAVAGATLSVLAVVAGAVAVSGGSGTGGDWSLGPDPSANISPLAYEDAAPTYADRQREIAEQLPAVFGAVLPKGMTVSTNQVTAIDATYWPSGGYVPMIMLGPDGGEYVLSIGGVLNTADISRYTEAFAKESAVRVPVAGGVIQVAVVPTGTGSDNVGFSAWYQFTPADAGKPAFRFTLYNTRLHQGGTTPISAADFKAMVESPGFAKLQQLLDPSVPASAAAVRERFSIEAKMNAEAVKVLPPGFRLKLDPAVPGALELVGPDGVNTLEMAALPASQAKNACPVGSLCFAADTGQPTKQMVPDGKPRLGVYDGLTAKSDGQVVMLHVYGKPQPGMRGVPTETGKPVETAPQGPGLTPQQAMAIIKAPGVTKMIEDVQRLAWPQRAT